MRAKKGFYICARCSIPTRPTQSLTQENLHSRHTPSNSPQHQNTKHRVYVQIAQPPQLNSKYCSGLSSYPNISLPQNPLSPGLRPFATHPVNFSKPFLKASVIFSPRARFSAALLGSLKRAPPNFLLAAVKAVAHERSVSCKNGKRTENDQR